MNINNANMVFLYIKKVHFSHCHIHQGHKL